MFSRLFFRLAPVPPLDVADWDFLGPLYRQVVKLVGGWKGVGSWQVAQGLVMSTSSEAYPEWSVRPDIPMEEGEFEYKFVKVGEFGDAVWELGPNRRLIVEQKHRIPHAKADKDGEPIEGYCLEDPEEGMSDDPLLNGEDEDISAMSELKGEEGREEGTVSRGRDEAEEVEESNGGGGYVAGDSGKYDDV